MAEQAGGVAVMEADEALDIRPTPAAFHQRVLSFVGLAGLVRELQNVAIN